MADSEQVVETKHWIHQHWREVLIGAGAALAAVWYLFLRGGGQSSQSAQQVTSPLAGGADVGSQQSAAQSAVAQDTARGSDALTNLASQLVDQLNKSSQSELDALNAAASAQNSQFSQQQQQQQQVQSGFMSAVQGLLAQITQAGQASLSQMQAEEQAFQQSLESVQRAQGTLPSGATSAVATSAADWAKSLGIDASVAAAFMAQNGGKPASSLDQLNAWLSSNHINPTMSIQANQYKSQQGSGYQPGNQPATANSPAGGGLWKGQTDQQIKDLFTATYGSVAAGQAAWNAQHAAGG